MKLLIVTDAWAPQINGVVFTLGHTVRTLTELGHDISVIHPALFKTVPCPTYPEIRLALTSATTIQRHIKQFDPDAIHIATEGPLGLAARRAMIRMGMPFTTAYHTRFPEYVQARTRVPVGVTYRWLRHFHAAATRTMVSTAGIRDELIAQGFDPSKLVLWARGVEPKVFNPEWVHDAPPAPSGRRPIFLYAGRVAVEKNLDAFLSLDLPGEKWVVGGGPALVSLQTRYPDVRFFGPMNQNALSRHYRTADVFVFPSLSDTFGLVLLEAMACGCPIAALPARSTLDVLGASGAGVVDRDLRKACLQALKIPRQIPADYARTFSWKAVTGQFYSYLEPIKTREESKSTTPREHDAPYDVLEMLRSLEQAPRSQFARYQGRP